MTKIKYLTYKQIHTAIIELVIMMEKANYKPDIIMPIAKGGIVPAGILGQHFLEAKFYMIQTKSYISVDKQEDSVKVYIPKSISKDIEKDAKILIVDDIYDTGKTMQAITKVLKDNGIKNNTVTATLYYKEESNGTPDFFAESIKKGTWLHFPWELKIKE
jgi:hypothetical protein